MRYRAASQRDKPFGEVRYAWRTTSQTTTPAYSLTRYTFTGQYSHVDDPTTKETEGFGLMFYNARYYDPALGRFAQADSLIPGGAQGYDRYAYANNSPVVYTDPSGHMAWEGDGGNYTFLDQAHDAEILKRDPEQERNREIAETILYEGTELGLWTFAPPIGLFFQTINGEPVSGLDMAFAILPLGVADDLGSVVGSIYKEAVHNPNSKVAILGKFIEGSAQSYEQVGEKLKATYLFSDRWEELGDSFGKVINEPFIQKEIIDKGNTFAKIEQIE